MFMCVVFFLLLRLTPRLTRTDTPFPTTTLFRSQTAQPPHTGKIKQAIKKLNTLGSVLYFAAHPDDENTRLIAWLAKEKHFRTGYLSLTRGDGGQNLIGTELAEELGLIRTNELLAAREVDGGEQFFSSAIDFSFSRSEERRVGKEGFSTCEFRGGL